MKKTGSAGLHEALKAALAPGGFARRGSSWFRTGAEHVEVVNLQRSRFGDRYFLNYAIWLLALGEAQFPREASCHVRTRISSLLGPAHEAELNHLLDLTSDELDVTRKERLSGLVAKRFVPIADRCQTTGGLREVLREQQEQEWLVARRAARLLLPAEDTM